MGNCQELILTDAEILLIRTVLNTLVIRNVLPKPQTEALRIIAGKLNKINFGEFN